MDGRRVEILIGILLRGAAPVANVTAQGNLDLHLQYETVAVVD